MTDPTTNTVRGWQVALLNALGGFTALPAIVTELQFISRRLFGRDSTGTEAGVEESPVLINQLIARYIVGATEERISIAELMRNRLGSPFDPQLYLQVEDLLTDTEILVNRVVDIEAVLNQVRVSLGLGTGTNSVTTATSEARTLLLTTNTRLTAILASLGEMGTSGGPLNAREYLAAIAVATRDAADCCEGEGGGGETAPAADPSLCGEGFEGSPVVSEYAAGDYSAMDATAEGMALVPGAGSTFTDSAAPWAPSRRAFRVTGAASAFTCLQVTLAPGDTGVYGVNIVGRLSDGSVAFTPGGFANFFPPSGSYTTTLPAEDSGGFDIYWYITVIRTSSSSGPAEPYSGAPPRIFLTEGVLS